MMPHDPELGPVERADLVKGYEYEKDHYVVFSDEDFAKVKLDSRQTIVIEKFVDADEVDPIYFDAPYYLAPDGAGRRGDLPRHPHAMRARTSSRCRGSCSPPRAPYRDHLPRPGLLVMTLRTADEVRDPRTTSPISGTRRPSPR